MKQTTDLRCPICNSTNVRADYDYPKTMRCCKSCGADFHINGEIIFDPREPKETSISNDSLDPLDLLAKRYYDLRSKYPNGNQSLWDEQKLITDYILSLRQSNKELIEALENLVLSCNYRGKTVVPNPQRLIESLQVLQKAKQL